MNRKLYADGIEIATDFECGAGTDIAELRPGGFRLVVPPDPPSTELARGYDYFFCARIANRTDAPRRLELEARRPGRNQEPAWQPSRVPIFVSDDFRAWFVADDALAGPGHEDFLVRFTLGPGEAIYLSNSIPCPPARMKAWLEAAASRHQATTTLHSIGASAQGRDILCLTVTDPDVPEKEKDRVLVTAGFHPAEADWLAATAVLETTLDDDPWAARVRRNFVVDVIPHANPDGFALGTNACNAHGVNLYWDFRAADPATAPEAACLWRWIERNPPQLYMDFHAYVHQLHKDFRPYLRPRADYPRAARTVVRAIDHALVTLCEGRAVRGRATNDDRTPAARITAAFGTITYPKFHVHLNHGIEAARRLGVDFFRTIIDTALPFRPLRPRTLDADRTPAPLDALQRRWELSGPRQRLLTLTRPPTRLGVPIPKAPGLAQHWHRHLWSHRPDSVPVVG